MNSMYELRLAMEIETHGYAMNGKTADLMVFCSWEEFVFFLLTHAEVKRDIRRFVRVDADLWNASGKMCIAHSLIDIGMEEIRFEEIEFWINSEIGWQESKWASNQENLLLLNGDNQFLGYEYIWQVFGEYAQVPFHLCGRVH